MDGPRRTPMPPGGPRCREAPDTPEQGAGGQLADGQIRPPDPKEAKLRSAIGSKVDSRFEIGAPDQFRAVDAGRIDEVECRVEGHSLASKIDRLANSDMDAGGIPIAQAEDGVSRGQVVGQESLDGVGPDDVRNLRQLPRCRVNDPDSLVRSPDHADVGKIRCRVGLENQSAERSVASPQKEVSVLQALDEGRGQNPVSNPFDGSHSTVAAERQGQDQKPDRGHSAWRPCRTRRGHSETRVHLGVQLLYNSARISLFFFS